MRQIFINYEIFFLANSVVKLPKYFIAVEDEKLEIKCFSKGPNTKISWLYSKNSLNFRIKNLKLHQFSINSLQSTILLD